MKHKLLILKGEGGGNQGFILHLFIFYCVIVVLEKMNEWMDQLITADDSPVFVFQ